jgi:HSP20 family protein
MPDFYPLKGLVDWDKSKPLAKWLHYKPYRTGHGDVELFEPAVDVVRNDNRVIVQAEMPGLKPEDIDVELHDDHLYIRGKKTRGATAAANFDQQEREYGVYHRRIPIDEPVNPDAVEAQYQDGVLTIVLAMNEPRKMRKIEVRSVM